jgi:hypothetical protein
MLADYKIRMRGKFKYGHFPRADCAFAKQFYRNRGFRSSTVQFSHNILTNIHRQINAA